MRRDQAAFLPSETVMAGIPTDAPVAGATSQVFVIEAKIVLRTY